MTLSSALLAGAFVGSCCAGAYFLSSDRVTRMVACSSAAAFSWLPILCVAAYPFLAVIEGQKHILLWILCLVGSLPILFVSVIFFFVVCAVGALAAFLANRTSNSLHQLLSTFLIPLVAVVFILMNYFNQPWIQLTGPGVPASPAPQPVARPSVVKPAVRAVPEGKELASAEEALEGKLRAESPSADGVRFPLYRQRGSRTPVYTASELELKEGRAQGNTDEGKIGYVFGKRAPGTVPLFHLFGRGEHLYTVSQEEARNAVKLYQYSFVDLTGFVFDKPQVGLVTVYRHWNGTSHFYTADQQESSSLEASGWKREGAAFYLGSL